MVSLPSRLPLLPDVFALSARRHPDAIAVEIPPGAARPSRISISYAELDSRSDILARHLAPSVARDRVVGILLPRENPALFIAQLAVLKCGAAYACLDPTFPDERVQEILKDAEATVLLTDAEGIRRTQHLRLPSCLILDLAASPTSDLEWNARPTDIVLTKPTPDSLAYVIYTSGTTGRPKGVMIEHRSIANLVRSDIEVFQLTPKDRVAQGSSPAYDSSVEEIWLAWAVGATLVVMDDHASRLGPDLVEWLRVERITVFCPPPTLLRGTGCENPSSELPDLKLLYVGGEALPRDVADRWSVGMELVNGYGPTECTVTCLREGIQAGQPITIGRPVSGASAWVLDEALNEVPAGESGELCIGGIGLARGYWKRPDLTAEKFPVHPTHGRIYRTGDWVHRDAEGRFFYEGRIDAQVKLRGYRIELGEVESRLVELPGVRAAACRVQRDEDRDLLVAFVLPRDPNHPPDPMHLRASLERIVPSYMVPARIGFLESLPTTIGGKLNRNALPRIEGSSSSSEKPRAAPRTPLEATLLAAIAKVLRRQGTLSVHDDFFTDLGGDSLTAAQLITVLRSDPATASLAVRDVYEAPTAAALAARAHSTNPAESNLPSGVGLDALPTRQPSVRWATCLQSVGLLKGLVVGSWLTYWVGFHVLPWLTSELSLTVLILIGVPLALIGLVAYTPMALGLAVLTKRALIGTYQPTRAPAWGSFYLRNWMVQRTVRLVPWWLIEGTEFQCSALRALGARIGRRVHIHRGVDLLQGGWDLLEIGDNVTLQQDVALRLVEFEWGHIVVGPIRIGSDATLETHSTVGRGAVIDAGGFLGARSSLRRGDRIPRGEYWDGIPARPAGHTPPPPALPPDTDTSSPRVTGLWMITGKLTLSAALALPVELLGIALARLHGVDAAAVHSWIVTPELSANLLRAVIAMAVLPMPFAVLLEALACRAMGRVPMGTLSRWTPGYIRIWLKSELVESGSRWLYGTLFWPVWLRIAGMKVGAGCELSTLIGTVPESIAIGSKTFCADGIYLGAPKVHRGTVTTSPVSIGSDTFIGNGAIIAGGQEIPDNVLLGICTLAGQAPMRPGTGWFGHPAFELPRREILTFDRRLTHEPTAWRYGVRLFWEFLRFALPFEAAIIIPLWFHFVGVAAAQLPPIAFWLCAVPGLALCAALVPVLLTLVVKWTLIGKVRPGAHPLWSSFASRWDFHCLSWNLYAGRIVTALEGTLWLNMLLRAMGARVGRRVLLGPRVLGDLADPDMMTLEDNTTVDCLFQAHTFEDRVLKMDHVIVRRGATVGRNTVLLYGADIGENTEVAPNSVILKHERLLPHHRYEGFPTRMISRNQSNTGGSGGTCR